MQQSYRKIKDAGLGLAAISYDSPEILKNFAQRKSIQFPLLSDPDSRIIRRFGILNQQTRPDSPTFGIPYPGIYVLDAKGVVTAKYFEDDYKERDTAAVILMKQFGLQPDEHPASTNARHLQLSASASDGEASMGQHLSLILDVKLAGGVHVYAPEVKGYIPIDWELDDSPAFKSGPANYPESKILRLQAIQESVPVYAGAFRITRDVIIGNEQAVKSTLDTEGNLKIGGKFRYQACDDEKCYLPETVPISWTIHFLPLDRQRVPEDMQHKPQ